MRKAIIAIFLIFCLTVPVCAAEYTAPEVPEDGAYLFPEEPENFAEGVWSVFRKAMGLIQPAILEASSLCLGLIAVSIMVSVFGAFPDSAHTPVELIGTIASAMLLLKPSHTLIRLSAETVRELSDYGKLLLPVMTGAVAAQGGMTTSTALYVGTAVFDAVLCSAISGLIVPMLYVYLCLAVAGSATGQELLDKLRDFIKWLMVWCLKIILYVFVGYIGVTGVVSGTADASAIKAAKLAISGMVPVVGSILSDASETILVSAGVMKNAAGIYGLLAILCIWIGPFVRIGVQYLLLKATAAICRLFSSGRSSGLVRDFSAAMGLLAGMTGAICLLLFVSTVCFMKGVS